jgi:hypothetical protein
MSPQSNFDDLTYLLPRTAQRQAKKNSGNNVNTSIVQNDPNCTQDCGNGTTTSNGSTLGATTSLSQEDFYYLANLLGKSSKNAQPYIVSTSTSTSGVANDDTNCISDCGSSSGLVTTTTTTWSDGEVTQTTNGVTTVITPATANLARIRSAYSQE